MNTNWNHIKRIAAEDYVSFPPKVWSHPQSSVQIQPTASHKPEQLR